MRARVRREERAGALSGRERASFDLISRVASSVYVSFRVHLFL